MVKIIIKISDPQFSKGIEVDDNKYKTLADLKSLIADTFLLEPSQYTIENAPKNQKLDPKVKEYNITIKNNSKNIKFHLPNISNKTITDGYKKKFNEIIEEFQSNKIYFSLSAEDILNISYSDRYFKGKDLKKYRFPFLGVPANTTIDAITTDSFVILEFNEAKFYLSDEDTITTAKELIFGAFRKEISYSSIKITKVDSESSLPGSYTLKNKDKYNVHAGINFTFKNLTSAKYNFRSEMDNFITVSGAQKYLHERFKEVFKIEDFHIMTNENDRENADEDQELRNYADKDGTIYYDIEGLPAPKHPKKEGKKEESTKTEKEEEEESPKKRKAKQNPKDYMPTIKKHEINDDDKKQEEEEKNESTKIKLIFEGNDSKKYSPITVRVNLDTTINDLLDKITHKYKIKEEIQITYKVNKQNLMVKDDDFLINIISAIIDPLERDQYDNKFYIKIVHPKNDKKKPKKSESSSSEEEEKIEKKTNKKSDAKKEENKSKRKKEKIEEEEKEVNDEKEPMIEEEEEDIDEKKSSKNMPEIEEEEEDNDDEKESSKKNKKCRIYYKTNQDEKVEKKDLKLGTNVKQLKAMIAKENKIKNPANIKIIFAGKDLLDDIVLDELNVGDTPLFVYIRTEQEIFLMTAKALRVDGKEDNDDVDNDDDDDDDEDENTD